MHPKDHNITMATITMKNEQEEELNMIEGINKRDPMEEETVIMGNQGIRMEGITECSRKATVALVVVQRRTTTKDLATTNLIIKDTTAMLQVYRVTPSRTTITPRDSFTTGLNTDLTRIIIKVEEMHPVAIRGKKTTETRRRTTVIVCQRLPHKVKDLY
uniref:Uncharacterized protein n=1 Tax=Cacopsylla melanoneura TaxID=428564 RepID=A0A8D9FBU3_9HEMI